jgi:Uma2 family endonuclease
MMAIAERPMSIAPPAFPRLSAEEFERWCEAPPHHERLLELIGGEVYEKMPSELHGTIAANVITELRTFSKQHQLGRVTTEARYRPAGDDYNSRLPDVAFMSKERMGATPLEQGSVPHLPDLCVEIKSPTDSYRLMRSKAEYYLEHGVRLVWLIFPEKQLVEVYRPGLDLELLTAADTLHGYDVLTGFALPVQALFED